MVCHNIDYEKCIEREFSMVIRIAFIVLSVVSVSVAQIKSGYIKTEQDSLYYEIYGKGKPIVIVHGGPGLDHSYLMPQLKNIKSGYSLIFYDQRGTGKSSGKLDSNSINVRKFVLDLENLRRELNIPRMIILGHSWGTFLAIKYSIMYPENVERMILADPIGASYECMAPFVANREARRTKKDSIELNGIMNSDGFKKSELFVMKRFAKLFFKSYFSDQSKIDDLNLDFTEKTAQNFLPIVSLFYSTLLTYDIKKELTKVACPTLILHAQDDVFPAEFSREIHKLIKGSKYVVIKHAGHFPFVEAPQIFTKQCSLFLK